MNTLLKKLHTIKYFNSTKWEHRNVIKELYQEGKIEFESGEYHDRYYQTYKSLKKDLKSMDDNNHVWSTYENCIEVSIRLKDDGSISAGITLWNGRLLDGSRIDKKWTAVFTGISESELIRFQSIIEYRFKKHIEGIYEDELELQRLNRLTEIENEILST